MITPGGQPYFLPGGPFGCLLIHNLGNNPQEMRWLGTQLNQNGFSVLAIRLFGHATSLKDLQRARYLDWIASMEDGFSMLQRRCDKLIVVGVSLGSTLALIAGAKHDVDAIVAISPAYDLVSFAKMMQFTPPNPIFRLLKLGKRPLQRISVLPGVSPKDRILPHSYPTISTRTISEIDSLLEEMRRLLHRVDVPTLLIHTNLEKEVQSQAVTQILDHLITKRVKVQKISRGASEETLFLERERLTGAITSFVTSLPGFQQ
jgi:carboxylesterase